MPATNDGRFINPSQLGGIESYQFHDGPHQGGRALVVNTGSGLIYRVLPDRGLDIDQATFNGQSLGFLTHRGVVAPSQGLYAGEHWLKNFFGGLLTSCGPFNIGPPCTDKGEELGLHGPHANTPATIESVIRPDPRAGGNELVIRGLLRYGAFYGPCVEMRRTIRSVLGGNTIEFTDEFFNAGNATVPHAWLLHINFGYPLLDEGAEFCFDSPRLEPREDGRSADYFAPTRNFRRVSAPPPRGTAPSVVAYLFPRAGRNGQTTVGLVNRRLNLGVAVHYNVNEFPRLGNWQSLSRYEYVAALEPMNGTVDGRDKDRARGLLDHLRSGERKTYRYAIEVINERARIDELRKLNSR